MNLRRRGLWEPFFAGFLAWAMTSPIVAQVPVRTLLAERVVPNPPLPPLEAAVENRHSTALIVGYVDLRKTPPRPREHLIKPGETQKYLLDRDAGATIERVYELITAAGNVVEQVERVPVPPVRIWDLVVWEYKTTYQVVGKPELDEKSRRSIGVIPLPPGAAMPPKIDVYQAAIEMNNPGAAAAYLNPQTPPSADEKASPP
jgi:hypothetical protein